MDLYHLKFYNAQKHPNTFIGLFCIIKCQRKRLLVYCTCFISSRFKEQLHIYPTCFFSSSLKQNLNAQDIRLIGRGVQRVSSHLSPPPHRLQRSPLLIAWENSCFSSLFASEDISRGITSVTQQQKFHTGDIKSVWNPVRSADWSME